MQLSLPIRYAAVTALCAVLGTGCSNLTFEVDDDEPIDPGSTVYSLLETQINPDDALNIVFLGDDSYGDLSDDANLQAFLDDLGVLIESSYWQNQSYYVNLGKFNYFYMTVTGEVDPPVSGICPDVTWPAEVDTDAAFADLVLLLHTNPLRDCRWGNKATSEPTSFRTVVHESSHALFNLPDEYCCDGGYRDLPPVMYTSQNDCDSDPDNAAWRNCVSLTDVDGTVWWRSEGDYSTSEIMISGGSTVTESGPGDWAVMEDVLDDVGSPNVGTPTVFAPDAWSNP